MSKFALYKKKHKIYPETVEINGNIYAVNADFRNILRFFDLVDDVNTPENKKLNKLKEWFFHEDLSGNLTDGLIIDAFLDFINIKNEDKDMSGEPELSESSERRYCFNSDAEEIYAGFLSEYNIDLIDTDFLHFYKFRILLENLSPESAFKRKIELRFMNKTETAEIAETITTEEITEFNEIWGKAGGNAAGK